MKDKLRAYCRREALFVRGEAVVCAVSGGADSMALLWCLHALQGELCITVSAAHFNHRLRGAESERDEAFVREFCAKHSIALAVDSADVALYAKEHRLGLEEAARLCRYRFFDSLQAKVATAHNADDNAETVLLHLLRGSGLRGLCGIAPKRGNIVRPLLSVTRSEILAFLQREGIGWVEDSTNAELSCTRNRLRHEVLPLLRRENAQFAAQITKQCALLRSDDALLDAQAQTLVQEKNGAFCIAPLLSAPDALQKRALRLLLRRYLPQDVSLVHINALQALLKNKNPSAKCDLPDGWSAQRQYDYVTLTREGTVTFPVTELIIPGETRLPTLGWKMSCQFQKKIGNFSNTPFHFAVKYDMIASCRIFVRPRQSGDRLVTKGGHTKTLKKLFIDCKIPRCERDRLPVFTDGENVLAVAGLGVHRAYAPTAEQSALIIHVEKEEMPYDPRY